MKKIKKLSWNDFELLCMELFASQGWSVQGNEKKGADGGVDIRMSKKRFHKSVTAIVQCKRYDETRVAVHVVREMYGLMYDYKAEKAFVVTTSRFTKECYKFVEEKNIELIDGDKLVTLLR